VTINGQRQLTRQGHQLANSPKRSGSIWVRQDFGDFGEAKGVWVGAGARFVGNRATSDTYRVFGYTGFTLNPGQTAIAGNGGNVNFTGGQLVEPWRLQSYTVFDLSAGARFQLGKVRYNAAVSVKNLTDEGYLVQRHHFGAPRTFELRLTTSF
jgi:outer membrane receptor for monomeric catechols